MRRPFAIALALTILAAGFGASDEPSDKPTTRPPASNGRATPQPAPAIRFDREIQPLLTQRCVPCHNDSHREGGLSLQSRESALAALESGAHAIVPGKPRDSVLLRRIQATDPAVRMPPKGNPLTPQETALLQRWIESGAPWEMHWSYRPLVRPALPDVTSAETLPRGARNHLDRFIGQRLAEASLVANPPASPGVVLRRVYFNLIGLPPNEEEFAEFLADERPDAYERVVDRLLAKPQLGERWARHWMDLVHFAETHGHDQDRPRPNAWPYRDYLIRALNDDRPYGQFLSEQIAGDLLAPHDPLALTATGFLAAGPWDESSLRDIREDSIDREIGRYLDRDDIVTTVMNTFASTTIHCARCHDHKFDPISQQDYYSLQAVFAATDKADRAFDADPAIARRRNELTTQLAALPQRIATADSSLRTAELEAEVAAWERQVAQAAKQWQVLDPAEFRSESGSQLTKQADGSLLASGTRPEKDTYTIIAHSELNEITGFRLEVLTDPSLPHQGPGRQDNGNLHLNELRVTAAPRDNPTRSRPLVLRNPRADFDQDGWTIAMALDGNPATAWGIYPQVGKPHRAVFELAEPLRISAGTTLTVELQQSHGGGHLIGRPRLAVTSAGLPLSLDAQTLPAPITAALAVPAERRDERQRAELAGYVLRLKWERELASLPAQQFVYSGTSQFKADGSFRPATAPRPVFVLHRGDIHQRRDEAQPGAMRCLPGLPSRFTLAHPEQEGTRRLALAQWLSDPRNGLTWRSIANRIWHYHFGRGLVDTPSDLGAMGGVPSHPELLDWLAVELQENQQSLKALHRQIVTSATYRQASTHRAAAATIDGENRLLWRMQRSRLDAECVHDAVACITRTLNYQMGGPSARQFIQTAGVHVTPTVDYQGFSSDDPANYRRSVYRFLFRTLPDPFMESLDCPDASQLTPNRTVSVTALQALAMLNDKYIVRQCEHLEKQLSAETPDIDRQVDALVHRIFLRSPTPSEHERLRAYVAQHGLANAARWLLNANEFMFVD